MVKPQIPVNDVHRLEVLREYDILDTIQEREYEELTFLASQICNTPISLVSLVDNERQWFKSSRGLLVRETPREFSFCAHAINNKDEIFVVNDSREDNRFNDNPLVVGDPHVVFYAGAPLVAFDGSPLGTLCVIDNRPRNLSEDQLSSLKLLSNQVTCQMELRRKNKLLQDNYVELRESYKEMEQFASVAAHDLKGPLNNITTLIGMVNDGNLMHMSDDGRMYLNFIQESSEQLTLLINDILTYSKATQILLTNRAQVDINKLIDDVLKLINLPDRVKVKLTISIAELTTSRIAMQQIFMNLLNNAIKYTHPNEAQIAISVSENTGYYEFEVADNGPGMPPEALKTIFDLFVTVASNKNSGTGLGLAIVKKLVNKLKGDIRVFSEQGVGTTFLFTIKKHEVGTELY